MFVYHLMALRQPLDHLSTPLEDATFCVVDLETTGGSAADGRVTEVGAVKVRRGEMLGTFQTLVDPGEPVPAFIRLLTGISDDMLIDAPPIGAVLPSFLEFCKSTVLVAHNARYDVSFLNAALDRAGYGRLDNRVVDTAALARKLLAGEVANNKLATLALHFRLPHQPAHRAYLDALATTDLLHCLIERVAGYGVTTLDDLLNLSFTRLDKSFSKIRLADGLASGPGVYRFLGANGMTLYVGKASDMRSRVRSYFYGDPRAKIRALMRETQSITGEAHASTLEAEVAEARSIARELPPYNRVGKGVARWYVKFSTRSGHCKLSPCRTPKDCEGFYLGPFKSARYARSLIDALRDAFHIHRCAEPRSCKGCVFAEMGTCAGRDPREHRAHVRAAAGACLTNPQPVYEPLHARLENLSATARFEEAEELRRRAAMLERALAGLAAIQALLDAGDLVVVVGSRALLIRNAQLAAAVDFEPDRVDAGARLAALASCSPVGRYVPAEVRAEAGVVASWLSRHADEVSLLSVSGSWAQAAGSPAKGLFEPRS